METREQASRLRNQYVEELRYTEDTLNLIKMGLEDFNELDNLAENSINNYTKSRRWNIGLLVVWSILLPLNALNGNFFLVWLSAFWIGIESYFTYRKTMKLNEVKQLRKTTTEKADQIKNIKDLLQSRQKFIELQIDRLTNVAHSNGTIKEEELQSIKQSLKKIQTNEYYNPYENVIDVEGVEK